MTLKIVKNTLFLLVFVTISACNMSNGSRLNGAWKSGMLGFSIDFNAENKTMSIKTGVSDISVKTTFDSIEESGDVINLIKKEGDKTVVTFKNKDEIDVTTSDLPISLTFHRVK
jgi:hypothetical protein